MAEKRVILPLYKGKGEQQIPKNSRPLCILSHVRKVVEKEVILELDRNFVTDKSQYGFQAGIKVTQAALSILAAIRHDVEFIVVLDLAKYYDNVLKQLMRSKLEDAVDEKLQINLSYSFLQCTHRYRRHIKHLNSNASSLKQGVTSSPALFRVFINDLPKELWEGLRAAVVLTDDVDPIRLVAEDVIGLTKTVKGLQILIEVCAVWAAKNGLS